MYEREDTSSRQLCLCITLSWLCGYIHVHVCMFCCVPSPGYNCTGWLGVKHQLTYTTALTTWSILSLSRLTVTELQNVQVTCTHHQYTHTQAVYKTTKMKSINYMYGCTLFSCKQLNDPRHRMTGPILGTHPWPVTKSKTARLEMCGAQQVVHFRQQLILVSIFLKAERKRDWTLDLTSCQPCWVISGWESISNVPEWGN